MRIRFVRCFTFIVLSLMVAACSKQVDSPTDNAPALNPVKTDGDAGSWKPILLANVTDIVLSSPIATSSPDYIIQLNEVRSWQKKISDSDRDNVKYWSAGAVLRWNEIMRDLVAKYNLPPYQNPDGTYPAPSANNPLAYPLFPFANPPYASRAYAYVAAAQYDALVTAYHYKSVYNRKAPYDIDSSLNVMVSRSDLSSFPSEDGAVIGATVELLKLLFPGEQDFIQKKAEDHRRARLIAGANVRSDIEAGEIIGRQVAERYTAKARTDRAGQAGGTPADWKKMEDICIAIGETPWLSLELPKRPPMLAMYGKVKSLVLDSLTCVSLRPGPPPSVNSAQMKAETEEIRSMVKNATREQIRTVHFWADGVATYTPAGHWNAIAADDFISKGFSEVRWARNLALLNIAMMDAGIITWDTKMHYFNPRPSQMDPEIKTLTGLPNFPAYISGHSTFSSAAASVLGYILPERAADYKAMALEASLSRMYGGIHFRSDCEVGLEVGENIAAHIINRGRLDGSGN